MSVFTTRPVLPAIETDFAELMSRPICTDARVKWISSDLQGHFDERRLLNTGAGLGVSLLTKERSGLGRA